MKYKCLTIFFCVFSLLIHAQHSDTYKTFTSKFVLIDTLAIDTKYANGFQKDSGTVLVYEYKGMRYEFMSGNYVQYDKKGHVITDSEFDTFGNYLSYLYFDKEGLPIRRYTIKAIETNADSVADFMTNPYKYTTVFAYQKEYRYSYKWCKNYLRKEGSMKNFNKIALWKIYNADGTLKKEKVYR